MPQEVIHRFEQNGKRFAIDPETCFCFECDEISWEVLDYFPYATLTKICHELGGKYDERELVEVVGELEWLRATKSILPIRKAEDMPKEFEVERGLKRVVVSLSRQAPETTEKKRGWFGGQGARVVSNTARQSGRDAVALLLNRSGEQTELELEFIEAGGVHNPELIAELCADALRAGKLAGKKLTAAVRVTDIALDATPPALEGHPLSVRLEIQDTSDVGAHVQTLAKLDRPNLNRLAKAIQPGAKGVAGRVIVQPGHAEFGEAVATLDDAGFKVIELDLDGAYVVHPELDPKSMLRALSQSAIYYAQRLLKGKYFRLDPIASLFHRIYDGRPLRRMDPSGTNELAIDQDGGIYPTWRVFGQDEFRHGSIADGEIDEDAVRGYEDVGSTTTGVCRRCWVRNLCGGGCAAVHHALTGSRSTPQDAWCDAQREWMGSAVSAFNVLSSAGVNFTRVYQTMTNKPSAGGASKLSMLTMVRAALGLSVRMRPIEEADAELLMRWENWSTTAYFLFNEQGVFLATQYDREMDSLHPQRIDQEMMLTKKDGTPFGLLKLRPERTPGAMQGWVYMRNEADYGSDDVRKGLRFLLKQASTSQSIRRLTVPAAVYETALQDFLEAVGFKREGTLREALYLHGEYHDVHTYGLAADTL